MLAPEISWKFPSGIVDSIPFGMRARAGVCYESSRKGLYMYIRTALRFDNLKGKGWKKKKLQLTGHSFRFIQINMRMQSRVGYAVVARVFDHLPMTTIYIQDSSRWREGRGEGDSNRSLKLEGRNGF